MFTTRVSSKQITLSWMMMEMYLFFKMVETVEIQSYRNCCLTPEMFWWKLQKW